MAGPLSRQQQMLVAQLLAGRSPMAGQVPVSAKGQLPANHPISQQMQDWPIPRGPTPMSGGELMRRTGKIR